MSTRPDPGPPQHRADVGTPAVLATTCARITDRLWIGGAHSPLPETVTVVITLEDTAPPITTGGVTEIRAPFPDSRWQPVDTLAVTTALNAAMRTDSDMLLRCRHGINRSALLAALVLVTRGMRPQAVIEMIRYARPGAFTNPYFVDLIHNWPHDPMRGHDAAVPARPGHGSTLTPNDGGTAC